MNCSILLGSIASLIFTTYHPLSEFEIEYFSQSTLSHKCNEANISTAYCLCLSGRFLNLAAKFCRLICQSLSAIQSIFRASANACSPFSLFFSKYSIQTTVNAANAATAIVHFQPLLILIFSQFLTALIRFVIVFQAVKIHLVAIVNVSTVIVIGRAPNFINSSHVSAFDNHFPTIFASKYQSSATNHDQVAKYQT